MSDGKPVFCLRVCECVHIMSSSCPSTAEHFMSCVQYLVYPILHHQISEWVIAEAGRGWEDVKCCVWGQGTCHSPPKPGGAGAHFVPTHAWWPETAANNAQAQGLIMHAQGAREARRLLALSHERGTWGSEIRGLSHQKECKDCSWRGRASGRRETKKAKRGSDSRNRGKRRMEAAKEDRWSLTGTEEKEKGRTFCGDVLYFLQTS